MLLDAQSNIAIISSDLKGQDIGLKAFDDILIASGEESRIRESRSQSGGFLTGGSLYSASEAVNGTIKTTANSASVEAKGNPIIEAGSATVIGSTLDAASSRLIGVDITFLRQPVCEWDGSGCSIPTPQPLSTPLGAGYRTDTRG